MPKLERVTFRFIPDANAALAALQAGDIDVMAFGLGPESVEVVRRSPNLQLIQGETTNDVILALNNSKKPFSDVRVRRAITHAIDKPEVVKGAMFGFGRVLGSNVDPLNPYFVDMAKAVPHDRRPGQAAPERRRATRTASRRSCKVTPQYSYTVRTGEVLVEQLAKVGIRVKLEQIEWGQWLERVYKNADYDMTIIGHAEAWDAGNYANPKYYYRYDSPRFQAVFQESELTLDDKKRRELYAQLQKIMADEAPVVWLYVYPRLVAAKKGVQGIWKDLPTPVPGPLGGELGEVAARAAVGLPPPSAPGPASGRRRLAGSRRRRHAPADPAPGRGVRRHPLRRLPAGLHGGPHPARGPRAPHHGHRGEPGGRRGPPPRDGARPADPGPVRRVARRRARGRPRAVDPVRRRRRRAWS